MEPVSASVAGVRLEIAFPVTLDDASIPAAKDLLLLASGAEQAIAEVEIDGAAVVATLRAPVEPGADLHIHYLGSGIHPIATREGAIAAPFGDFLVEALPAAAGRVGSVPAAAVEVPKGATSIREIAALAFPGVAPELVRELDLSGHGLGNLVGIGDFRGLRRLNLAGNTIADLTPLAELGRIERLDLSDNEVVDIWPLSALPSLRRVDLGKNAISDVTAVNALRNLEALRLEGNPIADLGPLMHLQRLAYLDLADTEVVNVEPLADLPVLRRLDIAGNAVRDISALGDIGTLEALRLTGNPLEDVGALWRLHGLHWVWFADGLVAIAGVDADGAPEIARLRVR